MRRPTSRIVALSLTVLLSLGTSVALQGDVASAATRQFTMFNQSLTHSYNKYAQPTVSQPSNWVSPYNYSAGRFYLRLNITSKPSTKALTVAVCMWKNGYTLETCSPAKSFSRAGLYYFDMGTPSTWWKKNGNWSWSSAATTTRLMIKDAASGKLLMTQSCGAACYRGSDIMKHVPITMQAHAIVVAKGATLAEPTSWKGCPFPGC